MNKTQSKNNGEPIYVTKPDLPPLNELFPYLESIWENKILTNQGEFHKKLEDELCSYLGVPFVSLFCNGTIALLTAMKAFGIAGEVITTPYSFAATAHSIHWTGNRPVFVDINPETLNIDPEKIEKAITPRTKAIMPVHVYGTPCDVEAIDMIAKKYKLRVIYDAAHAFGTQCHCGSLLNHGDLSVVSFHATKVFNTFEGGAVICKDKQTKQNIDQLKNFGFTNEINVEEIGINGKMNEFNAAVGLLNLKHYDESIKRRKKIDLTYRNALEKVKGIKCLHNSSAKVSNYSYFPIFVDKDYPISRDKLYEKFREQNIYARRYFYPLIPDFAIYQDTMEAKTKDLFPFAHEAACKVLCLPIYPGLSDSDILRVINAISQEY